MTKPECLMTNGGYGVGVAAAREASRGDAKTVEGGREDNSVNCDRSVTSLARSWQRQRTATPRGDLLLQVPAADSGNPRVATA
jgi:hypothetical protein